MRQVFDHLSLTTDGQRLYEITDRVRSWVGGQGITAGLLTLYIHHTSASLLIQENADAQVLGDLNDFFCKLVIEDVAHYTHTQEGSDDMPAHIRAALTATHLSIPIAGGQPTSAAGRASSCSSTAPAAASAASRCTCSGSERARQGRCACGVGSRCRFAAAAVAFRGSSGVSLPAAEHLCTRLAAPCYARR